MTSARTGRPISRARTSTAGTQQAAPAELVDAATKTLGAQGFGAAALCVIEKTLSCNPLVEHPLVLALLDRIFEPNYLLSQLQRARETDARLQHRWTVHGIRRRHAPQARPRSLIMWIFAYGSLIFRPSFAFVERRPAWVHGFARRFWQGSPDHRGTPEAPGRVVTLVPAEGETCGGCAYRIDVRDRDVILAELDHREKAGFDRTLLPLLDAPGGRSFAQGLTYVAKQDNPHFLGPLDEREIALHVARSHGPSGPNREYVVRLHAALRELGVEDPHVEATVHWLNAHPPA